MRAAVLTQINEPLEIMEFDEIPILQFGQVLVRVKMAGICGAQIREIRGFKGDDPYLPHMLGHEGFGVVMAVGLGVRTVKPGDHVVMHWRKGLGIEAQPAVWMSRDGRKVGSGPVSTWGEFSIVSENRLTVVPEGTPPILGALLGCALTTAFGIVGREAQLQIGMSVLVTGAGGGVGASVVWAASIMGAYPIYGVDNIPEKHSLIQLLGAEEVSVVLPESLDGKGFDIVVDCTGNPGVIGLLLRRVAPGGKLILVGQPPFGYGVNFSDMGRDFQGKQIMDSQGGSSIPEIDIPRILRWARSSQAEEKISFLTDRIGKLNAMNELVNLVLSRKACGRCLIEMI